jgi:hypothetical protein
MPETTERFLQAQSTREEAPRVFRPRRQVLVVVAAAANRKRTCSWLELFVLDSSRTMV